jgi:hypothetical protein
MIEVKERDVNTSADVKTNHVLASGFEIVERFSTSELKRRKHKLWDVQTH